MSKYQEVKAQILSEVTTEELIDELIPRLDTPFVIAFLDADDTIKAMYSEVHLLTLLGLLEAAKDEIVIDAHAAGEEDA